MRSASVRLLALTGLLVLLCAAGYSQVVKQANGYLDTLAFKDFALGVKSQPVALSDCLQALPNKTAWAAFIRQNGQVEAHVDAFTGMPVLVNGTRLPWVNGDPFAPAQASAMALKARAFMAQNKELFRNLPMEYLALNPERSGAFGEEGYLWFLDFDFVYMDVPIEGARLVFRCNHGNMVQFGMEGIIPFDGGIARHLNPYPSLSAEQALDILFGYTGGYDDRVDTVINAGTLKFLPRLKTGGVNEIGSRFEYPLVWEVAFNKAGAAGTWAAWIDAHSGQVISFWDDNDYGIVKGGIYPISQTASTEVIRGLPFANVASGVYANWAGRYDTPTSGTVTSTLSGKYVKIADSCGSISLAATAPADLNFSSSTGTDCTTPGVGGAGNTHAARSCYYHVANVKYKAMQWLPSNTWLQGTLTSNVNLNQTCNAYWNGSTINFFRSGGGCGNTGEIASIFVHEFAHGLDSNDGGATSDKSSGEVYGDGMAMLVTHNSCGGPGFLSYNCSGYGDACTACTGVREADYAKHTSGAPHTIAQTMGTTGFTCPTSTSYYGPCGREGHCEAYPGIETMWDLANRDIGVQRGDTATGWFILDRLFFLSRATSGSMYTCNTTTKTGASCSTSNWLQTFLVVDDTDGNLTNGTPHAAALRAAFARHGMDCTTTVNTNAGCTAPSAPTVTATAGNNNVALSWGAVTNAAKYFILRNDLGCDSGYIKIAETTTTSYTDSQVYNGMTYYYRVIAVTSTASCFSNLSACKAVTPTSGGTTTYTISGAITNGGGATVNLTGAASASTTADASGNYSFAGLANGTYTITPTKTGCTFSPTSVGVTISSANATAGTITATCASGDVALTSGVGYNDSVAASAWKYYTITVPSGATNLVIATTNATGDVDLYTQVNAKPTSTTYVCRPYESDGNESCTQASPTTGTWYAGVYGYAAGSYTITATVTTATATYSISGTITNGASATVNLTGAAAKTTTADASGNYTFTSLAAGTYTVTPSKTGCTFSPTSLSVTITTANQTGKNFTATCGTTTYAISGTVSGATASGVTMSLSGAATASTTTATDGTYTFSGLANGSYTVTPSKSGYTFSPTSTAVTISGASQTGKNFTATAVTGDVQLTSGVAVTGQSVAQGAWKYYYITVPTGATSLELKTTASTGDVDIYTQYNAKPTSSSYVCRPYEGDGDETCTQASPTAGTWWLGVYGYAAGSYTVTGTVVSGGGTTTLFTDGLDASTGWAQVDTSGTAGTWSLVASGTYPTCSKHGGTNMGKFNSYDAASGSATRYYRTAGFSTSAYTTITLTFWMYHDTGYSTNADKIQVQVSNGGTTWTSVGTAINRYDGSTGWKQHTVNLSSYKYADLRLGFLATSAYGNNMYADDVLVTGTTSTFAATQEEPAPEALPMEEMPMTEGIPEPVDYEIQ